MPSGLRTAATFCFLLVVGCGAAGAKPRRPEVRPTPPVDIEPPARDTKRGNAGPPPCREVTPSQAATQLTTAPEHYVEMRVAGVTPTPQGTAVVLVHEGMRRAIPVFISDSQALAIQLRLAGRRYVRPLTHDLLDAVVEELGGRVASVQVDELRGNTFIGTVVLDDAAGKAIKIDSRVSDALAIAVGSGVPVYVARDVIDEAAIDVGQVLPPGPQSVPAPTGGVGL